MRTTSLQIITDQFIEMADAVFCSEPRWPNLRNRVIRRVQELEDDFIEGDFAARTYAVKSIEMQSNLGLP